MPAETLVAIDGHYYAYKFFFGMPPLTGPGGRPTGVTYAFANLARDLRQNPLLTHLVCVFDIGDSFRNQIFADYKAHRDPMPDLLAAQLDDVEEILRASGVPILKIEGYEADDVLATLAKQAAAAGMNVRLCTKDKDIDQLLNDRIRTWDPGKDVLRGPKELLAEKGITPEQVIDYLCMIGDSADNVPGITGVGPKTAAKLLQQYGNLAAVLANSDQLKGKQKDQVEVFKPKAELTCRLIQLADVPGLPALDSYRIDRTFRGDEAAFTKFNFSRARFFPAQAQPASTTDAPYRILSLAELPAYIADIRRAGRFAFDTETTGLDPLTADLVGISMACGIPDARAAVYLPIRGLDHALVSWDAAKALLAPLFADPAVKKVGQNTKYDVRVLARHGIAVHGIDGDTMLASWLLDPARESHGIDHLTKSFLNEEKIATGQVIDLTNGQTMADVPVVNVAKYACEDAQCCWRLAQVLEAKLAENNLLEVYRTQEVPIAACLGHIEDAGLLVNRETLAATQRHLEQYLTEVTASIRKHAGGSFNPASPKQVGELLFTKLGLPVISQTKSGPSTDASVLEALRHLHELPDLLLQHRMLSKLIGTYLTRLPDYICTDGRIHTNLKQTGAETGRLASDSPNLQNIPKKSDLGREIRARAPVRRPDAQTGFRRRRRHPPFRRRAGRRRRRGLGHPQTAQCGEGGELRHHLWADRFRLVATARHRTWRGAEVHRRLLRAFQPGESLHQGGDRSGGPMRLRRDHRRTSSLRPAPCQRQSQRASARRTHRPQQHHPGQCRRSDQTRDAALRIDVARRLAVGAPDPRRTAGRSRPRGGGRGQQRPARGHDRGLDPQRRRPGCRSPPG